MAPGVRRRLLRASEDSMRSPSPLIQHHVTARNPSTSGQWGKGMRRWSLLMVTLQIVSYWLWITSCFRERLLEDSAFILPRITTLLQTERERFADEYRRERRQRTKPPETDVDKSFFESGEILGSPTEDLTLDIRRDENACPPTRSTVLITNILSSTLATKLVFRLSKHCPSLRIIGTDDLFPNIQRVRVQHHLSRLNEIWHLIDFVETSKGLSSVNNNTRWWIKSEISHVVHLEMDLPPRPPTEYLDDLAYERFIKHQSRWTFEHIWQIPEAQILHVTNNNDRTSGWSVLALGRGWRTLFPGNTRDSELAVQQLLAESPPTVWHRYSIKIRDSELPEIKSSPVFPCASSCVQEKTSCTPSVWDDVQPVTRQLKCRWAVITVNLDLNVNELVQPEASNSTATNALCRVAMVSAKSPIMQRLRHDLGPQRQLPSIDGWTVMGVDATDDSIGDIDFALPLVDPAGFFTEDVQKIMYLDYQSTRNSLLRMSNYNLLVLMMNIDQPAQRARQRMEVRPGTSISRRVLVPAEPSRRAALFVGQATWTPNHVRQYFDKHGFDSSGSTEWYQQYEEWVQSKEHRPNFREAFHKMPWLWASTSVVVHDVRSPSLRCEWLLESMQHAALTEELTLAMILARLQLEGRLTSHGGDEWLKMSPTDWIRVMPVRRG